MNATMVIFWRTTDNPREPKNREIEADTISFPYDDGWLMAYRNGVKVAFLPTSAIVLIKAKESSNV
jgi:hypothetical protein